MSRGDKKEAVETKDGHTWKACGDFPGGPVVRTLCFHCRGARVRSLVGELRSHKLGGVTKKKKKN